MWEICQSAGVEATGTIPWWMQHEIIVQFSNSLKLMKIELD